MRIARNDFRNGESSQPDPGCVRVFPFRGGWWLRTVARARAPTTRPGAEPGPAGLVPSIRGSWYADGGAAGVLVSVQRGVNGRSLPFAVENLVRLLEFWGPGPRHLPGLALAGINVPGGGEPRPVDALVFTPSGVAVLAVRAFTRPQVGTLAVPRRGLWTVDGRPAAADGLTGPDPGRQVEIAVDAVRHVLAPHVNGAGPFVTGLIVLFPCGPGLLLGDTRNAGVPVVLGDERGLRRIIRQHNRFRVVWSADGVVEACYTLSLAHLVPPHTALRADGFPLLLPEIPPRPGRARVIHSRPVAQPV